MTKSFHMCEKILHNNNNNNNNNNTYIVPISILLFSSALKVRLRSKFNVKFFTKMLSFQLIRSGCTCFGH